MKYPVSRMPGPAPILHLARCWLLAIFALLAAPTGAQPRPPGAAIMTVAMKADGVEASVALDRAVTRFAFAPADVVRQGDFVILTPGLAMAGDAVTAAKPFRRFVVRINPMSQERDAKYPAHFRVGAGGVIYAPALRADPAAWRTRLRFRTASGQVRLPASGDVADGFVFIGPKALPTDAGGVTVVADPNTPAWLVERVTADLKSAVGLFGALLEIGLPRPPLLIVRHEDGPRNFNVGDVTPGAVTALRFHGPAWTKPDEAAARSIRSFLFHEVFHFWNGGLASHAAGTPTWLHEGGAEYASLIAGVESGAVDDAEAARRLSTALQRCRLGLENAGDRGMAEIGFLSNEIRYPCGMVLQWAADLRFRRANAGRNILSAWGTMIAAARERPSRRYTLADFYAAAGIAEGEAFEPATLLVRGRGPERWRTLTAALNRLGAEIDQAPTPDGRRGAMLFHLLRQNCKNLPEGAGIGFYMDAGTIRLDSPAGCGVLAGDPLLKSVEGDDPGNL